MVYCKLSQQEQVKPGYDYARDNPTLQPISYSLSAVRLLWILISAVHRLNKTFCHIMSGDCHKSVFHIEFGDIGARIVWLNRLSTLFCMQKQLSGLPESGLLSKFQPSQNPQVV